MTEPSVTTPSESPLAASVLSESGQNVNLCYQCMKCAAGCPVSYEMDYKPAELIHAIQQAEGYTRCFGNSAGECQYLDCCFRKDCLKN